LLARRTPVVSNGETRELCTMRLGISMTGRSTISASTAAK
jgi:hypothetical protein